MRVLKKISGFALFIAMYTSCGPTEIYSPDIVQIDTENKVIDSGTVIDINGNVYKTITLYGIKIDGNDTIKITQTWMAENLRSTSYNDGTPIPEITDNAAWIASTSSAFCSYGNTSNTDNISTYGRLYNWYAIDIKNTKKIAPAGWHVASDNDWKYLITALGGEGIAGTKMKEVGLSHWEELNTGATNVSGLTVLPSGYRSGEDGLFYSQGKSTVLWNEKKTNVVGKNLLGFAEACNSNTYKKNYGFSVRCVKD